MSYEMAVSWRCNGCGMQALTTNLMVPTGWLQPAGLSQQAGPHLCQDCVQRAQMQPDALVPVSTRREDAR